MFCFTSSETATSTSGASASSYVTCRDGARRGGVATNHPSPLTPSHRRQLSASMHDAEDRSNWSVFTEPEDADRSRLLYARRVLASPVLLTR